MTTDSQPAEQPWTIGRLLTWTTEYLEKYGAHSPRLDAEVLLANVRQCERIMLYTAFDEVASDETRAAFRELVRRRAEGTPVAYLVGSREFYSLRFEVTPDVLIPRPETEYLVMVGLDLAKAMGRGSPAILDIGTGSGVVAVTVAHELPEARLMATDVSPAALAVARRNAERHGVSDRITFLESDLFAAVPEQNAAGEPQQFDIILSNPPYVSEAEMTELPQDVAAHEPHLALRGGAQGLEISQRLIQQAIPWLRAGGAIALETSPMLAPRLQEYLQGHPGMSDAQIKQDLAGQPRIVSARKA